MKLAGAVSAIVVVILAPLTRSAAQNTLLDSQRKALAVLSRAIQAHGGTDSTKTFNIRATLENASIHQSPSPDPPFGKWTVHAQYVVDDSKNRFLIDSDAQFPSFRNHTRTISDSGKGHLVDFLAKTVVIETNLSGSRSLLARILPQNLLREASARRASLRWLGQQSTPSGAFDLISYVRPSGELYTLAIDNATGLLARVELPQANTIDGDVVFVHEYQDYRRQSALMLPSSYVIRRGPWTVTTARIEEIRIGESSTDSDFLLPSGYRTIASYDPEMSLQTVAPGVHVINYVPDGYNVLCIEFSDHLVVVETPESNSPSGLSEDVIAFIKTHLPGKEIRFAVPTHHHSDHVGGVRAYLLEGATIISTRSNERFLRKLSQVSSSIAPNPAGRDPVSPRLAFLNGDRMILKDSTQELHLYAVSGAPHVNEILIAYLPAYRLLFQTDLFNAWACFKEPVPNEDIGHTTALGDTKALIAAIDSLGIDVAKVIGGHGRAVEYSWLKHYVAQRSGDHLPMWACTSAELR